MGIHTGTAQAEVQKDLPGGYDGYLTLTLVQRVMSAAHGGQVLLSNTSTELARGQLELDVTLRDLGGTASRDLSKRMFEKNILTFNPGWDSNAQKLDTFTDVRDLQRQLKSQGVEFVSEADESTTGPASFITVDPDGNPILVDQHV